jgi:sugar fermentation stimulation protein
VSADTVEHGRFLARENRFVARVRRADGSEVRAYVPNTARLEDLLVEGARVVLAPATAPHRVTRWTMTRVWQGTWVALDANAASGLVAEHLERGAPLPGWEPPVRTRREVVRGPHRFDLAIDLAHGREAVVEVKSLTSVHRGVAGLSATPSARGVRHLEALAALADAGSPTAVVFVVQRGDVESLDLTAPAAASWVDAVGRAREAGVHVVAFGCEVDPSRLGLGRPVPVRPGQAPVRPPRARTQATSTTATAR